MFLITAVIRVLALAAFMAICGWMGYVIIQDIVSSREQVRMPRTIEVLKYTDGPYTVYYTEGGALSVVPTIPDVGQCR